MAEKTKAVTKKAVAKKVEAPKVEAPKVEAPKVEAPKGKSMDAILKPAPTPTPEAEKKPSADLKDVNGNSVADKDYFFEGIIPPGFLGTCGKPVTREDLIAVFNKVFRPQDGILFYKQSDKEVYLVIVPIRFSSSIGKHNNSITGDFQKHAISFLNEGSVNEDALKFKLTKIKKFVKYTDR